MTQTLRLEGHSSTTEVYLQGTLEEVGKLVPQGARCGRSSKTACLRIGLCTR